MPTHQPTAGVSHESRIADDDGNTFAAGFFFAVLSPDATEPNAMIYLAYVGAALLTAGLLTLGVGLVRKPSGG